MRIATLLVSLFLTSAAYDLNLFRGGGGVASVASELEIGLSGATDELRQKKKIRQQQPRHAVIPPWMRGRRSPVPRRVKYVSVKSRDVRDSNQRLIRRKFNNM